MRTTLVTKQNYYEIAVETYCVIDNVRESVSKTAVKLTLKVPAVKEKARNIFFQMLKR